MYLLASVHANLANLPVQCALHANRDRFPFSNLKSSEWLRKYHARYNNVRERIVALILCLTLVAVR